MRIICLFTISTVALLFLWTGKAGGQEQEPRPESVSPEQKKIDELEQRLDDLELQLMQLEAESDPEDEEEGLKQVKFQGKARSLQMLNPELSAGIGMFGAMVYKDGEFYPGGGSLGMHEPGSPPRSGAFIRMVGIHLQSMLDPFSMLKVAFCLDGTGAHLGEAYITYNSVGKRLGLTLGRFRQPFGVVNRWHKHGLEQFDYPLMLKVPFGPGGLAQTGISLNWLMPSLWAHSQELIIQVTNSENQGLFAGNFFSIPSGLLRLKNYWDLSRNTYLELGMTGLVGFNNRTGQPGKEEEQPDGKMKTVVVADEPVKVAWAAGADLTLNWEPLNRALYRGVVWRSEFLYAQRDADGGGYQDFWGAYSYLQIKVARPLSVGVRGDVIRHFEPMGADTRTFKWQASPYITWWQSPWLRFHLQYDIARDHLAPYEHRVILQVECAAGPHKHERY